MQGKDRSVTRWWRCPRCEAALVAEEGYGGSLSRTTRDDGAEVNVCLRCGDREMLYGYDPADQVPISEWPVSVDVLVEEERRLIEFYRAASFGSAVIGPGDAKKILGESNDEDGEQSNDEAEER